MQLVSAADVVARVLDGDVEAALQTDADAAVELRPLPPHARGGLNERIADEAVGEAACAKGRLNRLDPAQVQRKPVAGLGLPALALQSRDILLRELRDE